MKYWKRQLWIFNRGTEILCPCYIQWILNRRKLKFCVRGTHSGFSTEGNWNSVSVVHSWFSTEGGWNSLSVVHTVGSQQRGAEILGPCYIKWILNRRGLKFCVRARYSGFSTERGWNSVSVLHTARRLYPILRKKALRLPPHKVTG